MNWSTAQHEQALFSHTPRTHRTHTHTTHTTTHTHTPPHAPQTPHHTQSKPNVQQVHRKDTSEMTMCWAESDLSNPLKVYKQLVHNKSVWLKAEAHRLHGSSGADLVYKKNYLTLNLSAHHYSPRRHMMACQKNRKYWSHCSEKVLADVGLRNAVTGLFVGQSLCNGEMFKGKGLRSVASYQ